jgi:hypothetical protein
MLCVSPLAVGEGKREPAWAAAGTTGDIQGRKATQEFSSLTPTLFTWVHHDTSTVATRERCTSERPLKNCAAKLLTETEPEAAEWTLKGT